MTRLRAMANRLRPRNGQSVLRRARVGVAASIAGTLPVLAFTFGTGRDTLAEATSILMLARLAALLLAAVHIAAATLLAPWFALRAGDADWPADIASYLALAFVPLPLLVLATFSGDLPHWLPVAAALGIVACGCLSQLVMQLLRPLARAMRLSTAVTVTLLQMPALAGVLWGGRIAWRWMQAT